MRYSVAIRTLCLSPDILRRELESLSRQTILPDKVVLYIADGYPKPDFNIMGEVYVGTPKGMVSQRAVDYSEIESDYILLLDDDVELAHNSAEILLHELCDNNADCVAADTFANHQMTLLSKIKAAVGNFVFPHFTHRWAFKLHANGSFSYINNPESRCYPSQSAAGPASLWRKNTLLKMDFKAERWLDELGFAYGDDDLEFFKLYVNEGRLFVSFNSGIKNLDAKTASSGFQKDSQRYYARTMSNLIRWHRMQYKTRSSYLACSYALGLFSLKLLWQSVLHIAISIAGLNMNPIKQYFKGIFDGCSFVRSSEYKQIPDYKSENIILH